MAGSLASVPPTGTPASPDDLLGREELVGKRFLLVQGGPRPKINRVADWTWKAGIIRCASHPDHKDQDLQVRPPQNKLSLCLQKQNREKAIPMLCV